MNKIVKLLMLAFGAVYVAENFFPLAIFKYIEAVMLLVMVVFSIKKLPKVNKVVVSGLYLMGAILLVMCGKPFDTWVEAFVKNKNLVTLFIFTPMISLPFFYDDYQEELKIYAQSKMQSFFTFAVLVYLSTHILGVLISVGSVAVIYELLNPQSKQYNAEYDFLGVTVRSYCSSGFWSPAWASIGLVSGLEGVSWVHMIPMGIFLTLVYAIMDLATVKSAVKRSVKGKNNKGYITLHKEEGKEADTKKLITMLVIFLMMILSIVGLYETTHWELMMIVSIVSVLFPLGCALVQRYMDKWKEGIKDFYDRSLNKVGSQVTLFAAAGFMGKALSVSGIGDKVVELIPEWIIDYPPLLAICLMLIIIVPSFIGVHPVVTGTALVNSIVPAALNLSTYEFIWIIITGWLLGILLSPFSATSLMAGGYANRPSWDISFKMNGLFGAVCIVVFSFLITLMGPVL